MFGEGIWFGRRYFLLLVTSDCELCYRDGLIVSYSFSSIFDAAACENAGLVCGCVEIGGTLDVGDLGASWSRCVDG